MFNRIGSPRPEVTPEVVKKDLPNRLANRLQAALPGPATQSEFAPKLSYGRHHGPPAFDVRQAAVLVLLYQRENSWHIPLTLRSEHLPDHAGQICLPGGMLDQDESAEQAALRELDEELGIACDSVQILGQLTPIYVFASNFWVTPLVGVREDQPLFRPNPEEVAQVVELPVHVLLDPANYGSGVISRRRISFSAPHIEHQGHRIWGATSMLLGELIKVLHDVE